jgi:hypothetical protein
LQRDAARLEQFAIGLGRRQEVLQLPTTHLRALAGQNGNASAPEWEVMR